jgi:hypothetical protein
VLKDSGGARTVHVTSASRGKHLFPILGGPKIVCRRSEKGLKGPPDIIVISLQNTDDALAEARTSLPAEAWARVAEGKAVVVFDHSPEAVTHTPERTEMLHGFLRDMGVPPHRAVYITEDRTYKVPYEAHCAEAGLGPPMTVLVYDYFTKRFFMEFETGGEALFAERLARFRARPARRERAFICLNRAPRHNKLFFLLSLVRDGLWDRGFISFSGFDKTFNPYAKSRHKLGDEMLAEPGFEDLAAELVTHIPALHAKGSIVLGVDEGADEGHVLNNATIEDPPLPERDQSWFTVVTETEFSGARRVTEKPFKSMLNFHPTLMIGTERSLELIRELGFQTYDGYFDEAYDQEPDPRRRFDMAYAEVRRLCALSDEQLYAMEQQIAEVMTFNARWGLTRAPALYRDEIDVKLMNDILRLIDQPAV